MPVEDPRREAPQGRLPARRGCAEGDGPPEESLNERESQTGQSPNRTPALEATRKVKRQASSAVAYSAEPLAPDDPLLAFEPVPHLAPRSNSITPELQRKFIAHLAATGIVQQAARHIGKSVEAIYKLRQKTGAEGFRGAWEAAVDRGVSRVEDCALARAIKGEERTIVSGGKVLGTEVRHNEALVMFFLRNRRRDRYDPHADIGPGHSVYERVRQDYEAEQARIAADPKRIEKVQAGLTAKLLQWRMEWEEKWEREKEREAEKEGRA